MSIKTHKRAKHKSRQEAQWRVFYAELLMLLSQCVYSVHLGKILEHVWNITIGPHSLTGPVGQYTFFYLQYGIAGQTALFNTEASGKKVYLVLYTFWFTMGAYVCLRSEILLTCTSNGHCKMKCERSLTQETGILHVLPMNFTTAESSD